MIVFCTIFESQIKKLKLASGAEGMPLNTGLREKFAKTKSLSRKHEIEKNPNREGMGNL
jgi:hypothetical protein